MEHIDMMEKLHEKANISLAEARDVLERAEWDMLEALVILEREGKIQPLTNSVSTMEDETLYEKVERRQSGRNKRKNKEEKNMFWKELFENLKILVGKCFTCSLVMKSRKNGNIIHIPLFIGIILCFVSLTLVAVGLLLGLLAGYDYFLEENKPEN